MLPNSLACYSFSHSPLSPLLFLLFLAGARLNGQGRECFTMKNGMCVRGRDIRDGDRRAESLEVQLCVNFLSLQSSLISLSSPVTSLLLSHTSYSKLHSARLHTKGRAFRTTFCGLVEENVRTLIVKSLKIKLIKLFFFSL